MNNTKVTFTHTVKSTNIHGTCCPGCLVRVTLDPHGTIDIDTQTTDDQGQVTFKLHPGTYYLWRSKPNWIFNNPLRVKIK